MEFCDVVSAGFREAGAHLCFDEAGADDVRSDSVWSFFECEGFGYGFHGDFCDGVGCAACAVHFCGDG